MSSQLVTILVSALGGGFVALAAWFVMSLRGRAESSTRTVGADFEPNQPAEDREGESANDGVPEVDAEPRANHLLATMSHEIRTPLNGVLGMLQLLDATDMSREQRRIVRTIRDSGQILSQVVDDHLAYFRLESGMELAPSPSVCELEEVVHQTMMLFQGLAYEKGLEFVLVGDSRAPHVVRTDALRLSQVLSNLILNAIKYTERGEVTVSIEQVDEKTEIAVSDTGPGMSAEDVEQLFQPYFRAEASAASQKGTGLGLVIARRLVEVMDGELEVESEPGMGTTFTLRFAFETLLETPPAPPTFPWQRALIVGGGPGSSMALAEQLEQLGLRARTVDNAALRKAQPTDLVFDFTDRGVAGDGKSPPGTVPQTDAVRIDVMSLSDPRAHRGDGDGHVLIEPFCRATVLHTLSELASGATRTSTIDRWRHSMAESFPLSILVAEDDVVSSQVIAGMLRNLGYDPTIVGTGPAAIDALGHARFDVALLDLNLPEFGGLEIVKRAARRDTWWIAMSASVQPEMRRRCRDAGFRDFLPKPLASGELQSALVRAAGRNSAIVASPTHSGRFGRPPGRAGSTTDGAAPDDETQISMPPASAAIGRMRELFAQSPDAYRDLLKAHIDQTDLLCHDLEQSLTGEGDPETARRATHTLQAAAASFGCDKVAAHARTIEAEWDALSPERRQTLTRRLIDAWRDEERGEIVREFEAVSGEMT